MGLDREGAAPHSDRPHGALTRDHAGEPAGTGRGGPFSHRFAEGVRILLREAGLSKAQAKALMAKGYGALVEVGARHDDEAEAIAAILRQAEALRRVGI